MSREPGDEQGERALVRRITAQGDEQAFRELYRQHSPTLYGLALRLLGGREEEAGDLLQEVWIRAVRRLPSFRWQSTLGTWLGGIAVNCCRERMRHERSRPADPLGEVADDRLAAVAPRSGERLDWERAIRTLPEGYRQVLVLCDIEGYTHGEVAGLLGIAPGTSKSQLSRARQALRRLVRPDGGTR